jgi:hypothetical protein
MEEENPVTVSGRGTKWNSIETACARWGNYYAGKGVYIVSTKYSELYIACEHEAVVVANVLHSVGEIMNCGCK